MNRRVVYKQGPNGPLHEQDPNCARYGCTAVELLEDPDLPNALEAPLLEEDFKKIETITQEAERLVFGDRQASYEHPRKGFGRTAAIWDALLADKLAEGKHIDARDVALLMTAIKLAREAGNPKRDNRVDIAGYALCLDRLEEEE